MKELFESLCVENICMLDLLKWNYGEGNMSILSFYNKY